MKEASKLLPNENVHAALAVQIMSGVLKQDLAKYLDFIAARRTCAAPWRLCLHDVEDAKHYLRVTIDQLDLAVEEDTE